MLRVMGQRVAALLADALGDDEARERDVARIAASTEVEAETITRLLEAEATDAPAEDIFRRLVEAAGVDVDRAVIAANDDGMIFEGAEWTSDEPVSEIHEARLVEAADQTGATPGTRRYDVVVIRPGEGQGIGMRIYTQKMLRENAANFGGQPIFFNHESLEDMLKRGHGSRDPRDLAGYLQESTTWDPDYTEPDDAAKGWEKGAVKGTAEFLVEAADYVDRLPKAVKLSINMAPTKLRAKRRKRDKKLGTLVEGVVKGSGSLDLITGEAGAGGRVLDRLREAAMARYSGANDVLAAALDNGDALGRLVEALAPELAKRLGHQPPPDPEDEVTHIDLDKLSDEDRARLVEAVFTSPASEERLVEALSGSETFNRLVEAQVQERTAAIREDTTAESDRREQLRDFRDEAHRLIEASALTAPGPGILVPSAIEDLKMRFNLREDRTPTAELDIYDRLNEASVVETPAIDVLREQAAAAIEREQVKLREAAPTRVRGLGPAAPDPAHPPDPANPETPAAPEDPLASSLGLDPAQVAKHRTTAGGR